MALASVPLHNRIQLNWKDTISNITALNRIEGALTAFLNIFIPEKMMTVANYQFISETKIVGQISNDFFNEQYQTSVELDPFLKFKSIQVDDLLLEREVKI